MRRRGFLAALGGAASPLAARAQPVAKVYRVGFVFPNAPLADMAGPHPANRYAAAFVQALRELGYLEGQNLVLERRSAEGRYERFQSIVAELVASKVDVIVGASDFFAEAGGRVGLAVPVVVAGFIAPLQTGVVASLARPGGNVTGFTFLSLLKIPFDHEIGLPMKAMADDFGHSNRALLSRAPVFQYGF